MLSKGFRCGISRANKNWQRRSPPTSPALAACVRLGRVGSVNIKPKTKGKTMRQQPSKKAIELRVQWLNEALGTPVSSWTWDAENRRNVPNKGNFQVDHSYGGYRIEQDGFTPFGQQRLTKNQLVDQLEAILVAIKLARGEKHGGQWPNKLES